MRLLSFLRRGAPESSEHLWGRLFAAMDDHRQLEALCRAHQEQIVTLFPMWRRVPEPMRTRPEQVREYGLCLIAIARCLAERLGDDRPTRVLEGTDGDSPISRIESALREIDELKGTLRYQAAAEIATRVLDEMARLTTFGFDRHRAILIGRLAECIFLGERDVPRALKLSRDALALCRRIGDQQGVVNYLESAYEIYRYVDDRTEAANACRELADTAEASDPPRARWLRRQAEIVASGEPLNRLVASTEGTCFELDEVPFPLDGELSFQCQRNRPRLESSIRLCDSAAEHWSRAELTEALSCYEAASRHDPFDPEPHYKRGQLLTELGEYTEAAAALRETERLAPGWFSCRSDLWLAERLADGALDLDLVRQLRWLEDASDPPSEKLAVAEHLKPEASSIPLFHLVVGRVLEQTGNPSEAMEAYRAGLDLAPDPETRTRLLARLAVRTSDNGEKRRLAQEAVELNGHLFSAASAQLMLRGLEGKELIS